jgi:N-acetylmuramoyl-L-alanine amidase CwlA
MILKQDIIPPNHPNRPGWKREGPTLAFIVHSTANIWPGAGDEWHARYFARPYQIAGYLEDGKRRDGICEVGALKDGIGTKFHVGATHAVADDNSVTQVLPLDEYAPGAGDRPLPYTNLWKGQKQIAAMAFGNRQNCKALQIEVCENRDSDWAKALANARDWIIEQALDNDLLIDVDGSRRPEAVTVPPARGRVLILRHYDLTGKNCPSRLVANPGEWLDLVNYIIGAVNAGRP